MTWWDNNLFSCGILCYVFTSLLFYILLSHWILNFKLKFGGICLKLNALQTPDNTFACPCYFSVSFNMVITWLGWIQNFILQL